MVIAFDLDDTIFPEIDYVRSAYREIARRYGVHMLPAMTAAPDARAAFDSTGIPIDELLAIYRDHHPLISLPWRSLWTLSALAVAGHTLALVTDGRAGTQGRKISALGLSRFIGPENTYISGVTGHPKVDGHAFRSLMARYPGQRYMYVGDNPAKDFAAPRSAGWTTVCLLDGGKNIHPQVFDDSMPEKLPDFRIWSLTEMPGLVNRLI